MTDVRAPEADPFESSAADQDDHAQDNTDRQAGSALGLAGWLRWAWRQLTSMRVALVLLFLLALGSVPGSMLPQQGTNPAGVQQYYTSHPALAPLLNHLGLFNVFGAPWFAAIYLLLFASLVGCVVPRTFRLAGSARALPPRAPRHLTRLPRSATYSVALPPAQAVQVAAKVLSGHGFRLRRSAERRPAEDGDLPDGPWVSAEKGYLREAGNLLFHLALLGVLVSVALGGLFGYKADRLLVQGSSFADTQSALDEFYPGRFVTAADLGPFSITLDKFDASYVTSGAQRGQPASFDAQVSYTAYPGGPTRTDNLEVNRPLSVDGAKVYLIGHGYAPVFKVTDARGQVVYDQATPFISGTSGNFLSQGVVKVPDAQPEQLGFSGVFVPTAIEVNGVLQSAFPAPDNPVVSLIAYAGNLGLNSGVSAVGLPDGHRRDAPADHRPAAAAEGPVAEAARRPGHHHVYRLRPVGEPGHHPRPRPAARADLRHRGPGRPAAVVHGQAQAGVRPRQGERVCQWRAEHGSGRRPDPDRRQRRLRGRVRIARRRAEISARSSGATSTRGRMRGHARQPCPGSRQQRLPDRGAGHLLPLGGRVRRRLRLRTAAARGFRGWRAGPGASRRPGHRGRGQRRRPPPQAARPTAGGSAAPQRAAGGPAVPDSMPEVAAPPLRAIRQAGGWVQAAMALAAIAVAAHTVAVVTRGLAVHRAPWGNMYEFVTALTCIAAMFFLFVMIRYRAWTLGVFVMGAVVVALGLAETLIYTAAGQLVPALQSYWLDIHVTAMTLATGIFFVAAVLGLVYLAVDRHTRRVAAGRAQPGNGIVRRLPSIEQLDRLTYRTVVFGFPVWTFGVIAGAIWADQAWGRYWGWDPVETWAFITWVLYAAFLHARATAGWRGRRAHYIQLLGFAALVFNIMVVQVFITGLHSYAGVS